MGISCLVYIDDIIVYSKTPEDHIRDVQMVLGLLKSVNFQVNLPKSEFFCREIGFLGMKLKEGEITVDLEKVEKVRNL